MLKALAIVALLVGALFGGLVANPEVSAALAPDCVICCGDDGGDDHGGSKPGDNAVAYAYFVDDDANSDDTVEEDCVEIGGTDGPIQALHNWYSPNP